MKRSLNRLSVLLLMLLGVLPQITLLAESLELKAAPLLWLWILGAAVGLWICTCFRRGILLGMPLSAALLYAAFRFFETEPLAELDDLADKFSGAFYLHFYAPNGSYDYTNLVEDHSFLLLLIAFLLLAYLSSSLTSRSGRRFTSLLGTIPLTAVCLSVNGAPSYTPVVGMLLFWGLVLVSGNYAENGPSGRILLGYSLPVLLLLSGLLILSNPEDYSFSEQDVSISRQFDRVGEWIRDWIENSELEGPLALPETVWVTPESVPVEDQRLLWESSEGAMDLTQDYDASILEQVFLRVTAARDGALYLRGISYGDYSGSGWTAAEAAPLSSLSLTAEALQGLGQRQSLTLQNIVSLRYALLPYFSAKADTEDAYVPAALQSRRESCLSFTGDWNEVTGAAAEEGDYRAFAHEVYTRLPEGTRSVMLNLAAAAGLDASSLTLTEDVAAYIRDAGVYDLDTAPYPSDDYAVYFLTVSHRGYCVHFATAAVAMYRALGIPARITEGFLVDAKAGQAVDVKGNNAHAWVEIYRDGIGWLPVEVTGQSGLTPIPEETPQPEETPEPNEPEEQIVTPTPEPSYVPDEESAYTLPVGIVQPQEEAQGSADTKGDSILLRILICIVLLLLIPLRRLLLRRFWQLRLERADSSKAAVALWKRSQALRRFGADVPKQIENCAEKAYFSAKGTTKEELDACKALFEAECQKLYSTLPLWKKFLFRFVFALK